jgi:hypothetical protein
MVARRRLRGNGGPSPRAPDREPRGSASIPVLQTLYGACSRLRPTPLKLRESPGVRVRKLANSYGISPQANKQK